VYFRLISVNIIKIKRTVSTLINNNIGKTMKIYVNIGSTPSLSAIVSSAAQIKLTLIK